MPVEEQLATIFEVLEGGVETTAEVIPFPVDSGATALEGTTTTVELGNGIATEVSQLTVTEAGATTTAGVGLLSLPLPMVALIVAPLLGVAIGTEIGFKLYDLSPEFWLEVSDGLLEAGQTVGGKVRAFIDSTSKKVGLTEETIEIFKNAFIHEGIFTPDFEFPNIENNASFSIEGTMRTLSASDYNSMNKNIVQFAGRVSSPSGEQTFALASSCSVTYSGQQFNISTNILITGYYTNSRAYIDKYVDLTDVANQLGITSNNFRVMLRYDDANGRNISIASVLVSKVVLNNVVKYICRDTTSWGSNEAPTELYQYYKEFLNTSLNNEQILYGGYLALFNMINANTNLQPDATYPDERPIPQTYPTWTPFSVPVEGFPTVYPVEIPVINPSPSQNEAQNPEALPDDNPDLIPWFIETLPQPDPNPDPYPEPSVNPDPDPAPEPEPIPDPEPEPTPENPVDPNPDPTPSPLPVVPDMPETVESNAMFTVYKPSMAQVNAFGGWLWSSSIVEAIKRIWQNPLDGIISFMKVYVDAPTSGSDTIKVGILDSEVSSPVVSGQFVTVECGSLNVREKFYNATDYSPFVGMHLYLPFIGIVELDIDEFMSGEIKVTYHVDVYTGTCLAEVKSRRSPDMPDWTIVYTFSGNASQQLPLTSAEFSGALSSLVGVVGGGLAIASGGGLGLLAGATGIAHAVTHEMVHLAHSGSLSANAGIMGARKPYLILTRRRSYDANGYNELYGYPSNKTVYLNNCSGYVKVKDIRLETVATDSERMEIENLLKAGVII